MLIANDSAVYQAAFARAQELAEGSWPEDPLALQIILRNTIGQLQTQFALLGAMTLERAVVLVDSSLDPLRIKLVDLCGQPLRRDVVIVGSEIWERRLYERYCSIWRHCFPGRPIFSPVEDRSWNLLKDDAPRNYPLANALIKWMATLRRDSFDDAEQNGAEGSREEGELWLLRFTASVRTPRSDVAEDLEANSDWLADVLEDTTLSTHEEEASWEANIAEICDRSLATYSEGLRRHTENFDARVDAERRRVQTHIEELEIRDHNLQQCFNSQTEVLHSLVSQQFRIDEEAARVDLAAQQCVTRNAQLSQGNRSLFEAQRQLGNALHGQLQLSTNQQQRAVSEHNLLTEREGQLLAVEQRVMVERNRIKTRRDMCQNARDALHSIQQSYQELESNLSQTSAGLVVQQKMEKELHKKRFALQEKLTEGSECNIS